MEINGALIFAQVKINIISLNVEMIVFWVSNTYTHLLTHNDADNNAYVGCYVYVRACMWVSGVRIETTATLVIILSLCSRRLKWNQSNKTSIINDEQRNDYSFMRCFCRFGNFFTPAEKGKLLLSKGRKRKRSKKNRKNKCVCPIKCKIKYASICSRTLANAYVHANATLVISNVHIGRNI